MTEAEAERRPGPSGRERAAPPDAERERAAPPEAERERAAPPEAERERAAPPDAERERAAPPDAERERHLEPPTVAHLGPEVVPVLADVAFADFYQRTRTPVARALALTLGDTELAVDAVDEAMARAYQRWPQVSTYDNAGGWVYRVGLNWARSALRVRRRSLHRLYQPDTVEQVVVDPDVARALGELSVNHRAVIVCRHLLGWSELVTAEALHIRPGTVKSRLSRATAHLQVRLGHLRPEEQP